MKASGQRIESFGRISTNLSSLSNRQLLDLLGRSAQMHAGIGGSAALLTLDETPIFVKRIAVTDLEVRPENYMSTANFHGLPMWCQYRLATPGFGVWREVLAHVASTNWVLCDDFPDFPLLYHWRILPGSTPAPINSADASALEENIRAWGNPPAIRKRFDAIQQATTELLLFLEYLPQNLYQWLRTEIAEHGDDATPSILLIEEKLHEAMGRMNARGLLHMDAHFENILIDGTQLYFSDFGLALSSMFDLSAEETEFFAQHRGYDRCNVIMSFAQVVVLSLFGDGNWAQKLRDFLDGRLGEADSRLGSFLRRNAPVALALREFYMDHLEDVRSPSFPAAEIDRLLAEFDAGR